MFRVCCNKEKLCQLVMKIGNVQENIALYHIILSVGLSNWV